MLELAWRNTTLSFAIAEKYNGTVAYLPASGREASVRIEWNSPQHEILAVINGKYILFRPRLNMAMWATRRIEIGIRLAASWK